jgi:hypothetical protein
MTDEPKKLTRKELRQLKPGDWVAWGKSNWDKTINPPFSFWEEAQVMAHPVRCHQHVTVRFAGLPHQVPKNRLYKIPPVIAIENMHEEYDYDS